MGDKFAYGVDLGWLSQLEQQGYRWVDEDGRTVDGIEACKRLGANAVRLRLFVDPPKTALWQKRPDELVMLGFCDAGSVLDTARRARALGMDLMLDLHYSDHFADPLFQDIPEAWLDDTGEELVRRVYDYTAGVLRLFKEAGTAVKWVQVGNEINPGLLLPRGSLGEAPAFLVRLLNAGYDAVKAVTPETLVITHLSAVNSRPQCRPFLDNFVQQGGRTDIFAFSYYPYWENTAPDRDALYASLKFYGEEYHTPVLVAEVGGPDDDEEGTYALVRLTVEAAKAAGALGVFYWEPDANRAVVPDGYPLGACRLLDGRTLQYTKALAAYRDCAGE